MSGECDKGGEHALECGCKNQCIGLLGKLFGHNFKRYLVKEKYKQTPNVSFDIHGDDNVMAFLESQ